MNKFNWYFYRIYLPTQLMTIAALTAVFLGYAEISWLTVFVVWFLVGPVGVGVGYHRLFSHRQFKTYRAVEYVLALLGTLAAYTPLMYWIAEHQHHHRTVDTPADINNPKHGFWHSFLYWRFLEEALKSIYVKDRCNIIAANDPMIRWVSKYFTHIVYAFGFICLCFGLDTFVNVFILPLFIEQIRINILNSISHINIPGSYQNFKGEDSSYNHVILGYLTMGFGWHNNHHSKPRELVNTHRWWEVDVEGIIGKLLTKKSR